MECGIYEAYPPIAVPNTISENKEMINLHKKGHPFSTISLQKNVYAINIMGCSSRVFETVLSHISLTMNHHLVAFPQDSVLLLKLKGLFLCFRVLGGYG